MKLLVLGVGSAVPTTNRNPTAQLLDVDHHQYLIDCGEGTQIQLRKNKISLQKIKAVFISHMHGDHYLGLMGLLWTMNLLGREKDLTICAPIALQSIIDLHSVTAKGHFNFPIHFIPHDEVQHDVIYEDKKVTVTTLPLDHKIHCSGFLFREQHKLRPLIPEKLERYQIPNALRNGIKQGLDYHDLRLNKTIPNAELTLDPPDPVSYAYCSDTKYNERLVDLVANVDLLYHESTFLDVDKEMAHKRFHSTAKEAAKIAFLAHVKVLLLGHYSNRYQDLNAFLEESKQVFKAVFLGEEGKWYKV